MRQRSPIPEVVRRASYRKKRRDMLKKRAIEFLGGKCVKCETEERLEFDHIDPATKCFSIAARIGCKWEDTLVELRKCQLLCYDCHREKTATQHKEIYNRLVLKGVAVGRPRKTYEHGMVQKYKRDKCRCDYCRAAHYAYSLIKLNKNKHNLKVGLLKNI